MARSADKLIAALPKLTEAPRLPDPVHALLLETREQLAALHARLARCDAQIAAHAKHNPISRFEPHDSHIATSRKQSTNPPAHRQREFGKPP